VRLILLLLLFLFFLTFSLLAFLGPLRLWIALLRHLPHLLLLAFALLALVQLSLSLFVCPLLLLELSLFNPLTFSIPLLLLNLLLLAFALLALIQLFLSLFICPPLRGLSLFRSLAFCVPLLLQLIRFSLLPGLVPIHAAGGRLRRRGRTSLNRAAAEFSGPRTCRYSRLALIL